MAAVVVVVDRGEAEERVNDDVFLTLGDFLDSDEDEDGEIVASRSVLRLFLGRPMGF